MVQEGNRVEKLVDGPRQPALREVHDWVEVDDRDAIRKAYHFADFKEAFGFVSRVALIAGRMAHHPELHLTASRVEVVLPAPEVEALTMKDIDLARAIDAAARERDAHR